MLPTVPLAIEVVAATPFTVFTSPPACVRAFVFVFMIGTVVPVTPFTVVLNVLALLVLFTPLTALEVAATPFTVLVSVLVLRVSVFVVAPVIAEKGVFFTTPLYIVNTLSVLKAAVACTPDKYKGLLADKTLKAYDGLLMPIPTLPKLSIIMR